MNVGSNISTWPRAVFHVKHPISNAHPSSLSKVFEVQKTGLSSTFSYTLSGRSHIQGTPENQRHADISRQLSPRWYELDTSDGKRLKVTAVGSGRRLTFAFCWLMVCRSHYTSTSSFSLSFRTFFLFISISLGNSSRCCRRLDQLDWRSLVSIVSLAKPVWTKAKIINDRATSLFQRE